MRFNCKPGMIYCQESAYTILIIEYFQQWKKTYPLYAEKVKFIIEKDCCGFEYSRHESDLEGKLMRLVCSITKKANSGVSRVQSSVVKPKLSAVNYLSSVVSEDKSKDIPGETLSESNPFTIDKPAIKKHKRKINKKYGEIWNQRLDEVIKGYNNYIPMTPKANPLYGWYTTTRSQYRSGRLLNERIDRWELFIDQLQKFQKGEITEITA